MRRSNWIVVKVKDDTTNCSTFASFRQKRSSHDDSEALLFGPFFNSRHFFSTGAQFSKKSLSRQCQTFFCSRLHLGQKSFLGCLVVGLLSRFFRFDFDSEDKERRRVSSDRFAILRCDQLLNIRVLHQLEDRQSLFWNWPLFSRHVRPTIDPKR